MTGVTKPIVLRITASFERFGYLRRDAAVRYALGPSLWRLGARYRDSVSPADAIRPVLAELVERTEETAAFYVRHGDHRVCLYRHNSPRTARIHVEEGDVLPRHQGPRTEEHTPELQSLMRNSYAVFCLKKKKLTNT